MNNLTLSDLDQMKVKIPIKSKCFFVCFLGHKDTTNLTPPNNMTCSLSLRTMMPPSFNLHLQCQEAILPSWRKLFPHMAELPPEVNHEERRRYRKSTFLFLRMFVPQHGMEHLACLPPSQATSPPFPAWPSLMGSTTPLNVRIIIENFENTALFFNAWILFKMSCTPQLT